MRLPNVAKNETANAISKAFLSKKTATLFVRNFGDKIETISTTDKIFATTVSTAQRIFTIDVNSAILFLVRAISFL
jgi:hypothetical protein